MTPCGPADGYTSTWKEHTPSNFKSEDYPGDGDSIFLRNAGNQCWKAFVRKHGFIT